MTNNSKLKIIDCDKYYRNFNGHYHREDGPAVEYANGDKRWYINGKLHRTDGPAIEHVNGNKEWYKEGKLHREDGPAVVKPNGYKEWWLNNKRHREDGPAIEHANGNKEWHLNGVRHRENAPAVEHVDGYKEYHFDGKLHREDGPAIIYPKNSASDKFYLYGRNFSKFSFLLKIKEYIPLPRKINGTTLFLYKKKLITKKEADLLPRPMIDSWAIEFYDQFGRRHREDGPAVMFHNGDYVWYYGGYIHRIGGPARYENGYTEWYHNGALHRADGPAKEKEGEEEWWFDGELHREGGPAIIRDKSIINDQSVFYQEWRYHGKRHRKDGPAIEQGNHKEWWVNGQRHREDGPAIERRDGSKEWYLFNQRHRADGPAIEKSGAKHWYYNGVLHRVGGPAVETPFIKEWYFNGQVHREDGPAIIDGESLSYYILNMSFTEKQYKFYIKYVPIRKSISNNIILTLNGKRITEEELTKCSIATLSSDGAFYFSKNGKRHREDGPAIVARDGYVAYYYNGRFLKKKDYFKLIKNINK